MKKFKDLFGSKNTKETWKSLYIKSKGVKTSTGLNVQSEIENYQYSLKTVANTPSILKAHFRNLGVELPDLEITNKIVKLADKHKLSYKTNLLGV